jgi:Rrf2 family transcriptional regulator, iron-sulfur cluster assembly transcription factor
MLSRSCVHAIRAVVVLASLPPGAYCGTSAIADTTGAPRNYLGKLLLQLSRRGLVESQKGLGGGFRLAQSPDKISLHDVVESIEDVSRWTECAFGGKQCTDETPCPLHHQWGAVRTAYMSLLRNTSIAALVVSDALANLAGTGDALPVLPGEEPTPVGRPR